MKIKVLTGLLALSLLLNIAGLVFFISFMGQQGKLRTLKRENRAMAQNLTVVRAANVVDDALESGKVVKHTFASLVDGREDWYALCLPSRPSMDNTLIVYLHGMGNNPLEPFEYPSGTPAAQAITGKFPDVCLLSCDYREKSSWGSDAAMSDITQNVREIMQQLPIKRIVLMGTSMGACTVLTYATVAPIDIRKKLVGIVSVEGAGNLKDLYHATQNAEVNMALTAAMGGDPKTAGAEYERRSFIPNADKLPQDVRVAIVSAQHDRIVPPALQQQIVDELNKLSVPVKLISVESGHGMAPAPAYIEGLQFALGTGAH
ncbi:MAG TPA: prolyl oligopeptidase family serine peptidase [Candidatus Obscuribacterales bacterium]